MQDCCKKWSTCSTQDHSEYDMHVITRVISKVSSMIGDELFEMIEEEAVVLQDKKDSVEYKEHLTKFENKLKESEDVDAFQYPHRG